MKKWEDLFRMKHFQQIYQQALNKLYCVESTEVEIYPPYTTTSDIINPYIFRALTLVPLNKVKVVILGQDPYHQPGQANGLAFSVNKGIKTPPSLRNIFLELANDLGTPLRTNTDLSDWAKQGVLLLNTSLTVIKDKPNSMPFWNSVTDEIIKFVDEQQNPVVFILWGKNAQNKESLITNNHKYIIKSAHPSPLSAYRGFFGSKPFSKTNQILKENNLETIKWS